MARRRVSLFEQLLFHAAQVIADRSRELRCKRCGWPLSFVPPGGLVTCTSCGTPHLVSTYNTSTWPPRSPLGFGFTVDGSTRSRGPRFSFSFGGQQQDPGEPVDPWQPPRPRAARTNPFTYKRRTRRTRHAPLPEPPTEQDQLTLAYRTLGLPTTATAREVKLRRRECALRLHQDRGGGAAEHEQLATINAAADLILQRLGS